jgi:DNA replication and repair protein RecF
MVTHGQTGYFVGATVISSAEHHIKLYWSPRERKLALDGQPIRRLTDYLGTLRVVAFASEDLQLIKGPARARRRFLDLLLSQTWPAYLPVLQRYAHALRARNALLKHSPNDPVALESFSEELVRLGDEVIRMRRQVAPRISALARLAYRRIAKEAEELRLEYQPGVKADFKVELAQSSARERVHRSTLIGPHRDELALLLNDRPAALFGSEGQKRSLAIALKLAQAEYLTGLHGAPPVLLIDDIMGELDLKRRTGFLPLLEQAHETSGQVFMTATGEDWPRELTRHVQRWEVKAGSVTNLSDSH